MKKLVIFFFICNLIPQTVLSQWFTQQSGTTSALYDIEFINRNTGWCCGNGGYIIKTTNGGTNWVRQSTGVPGEPLFGIHPVDSNIVYAVGFFRTFIKTTNGGSSWFNLDSGMQGDGTYISVFFINQFTGWIGNFSSPYYGVKKTTNGGVTLNTYLTGIPEDLFFKDSLNGIGVQGGAVILKTINGGINWTFENLASSGNFYRVSFINGDTGYTASTRAVYKTTNFGVIWDSIGRVTPLDIDVTSIEFSNETTGWAGTSSPVYKTTDGGRNWFLQILTGVVYSIYSHNDSLVWTCGNAGRIWHTTNGGISFISNYSNIIPNNFMLSQNFPNPFNSITNIRFSINKKSKYILEVFNSLGIKINNVFEQELDKGNYEVNYDAQNLSTGVYFYRLSGNVFSETKKFLLVK